MNTIPVTKVNLGWLHVSTVLQLPPACGSCCLGAIIIVFKLLNFLPFFFQIWITLTPCDGELWQPVQYDTVQWREGAKPGLIMILQRTDRTVHVVEIWWRWHHISIAHVSAGSARCITELDSTPGDRRFDTQLRANQLAPVEPRCYSSTRLSLQ